MAACGGASASCAGECGSSCSGGAGQRGCAAGGCGCGGAAATTVRSPARSAMPPSPPPGVALSGGKAATGGRPVRNPCEACGERRAALRRPKTGARVCKECFFAAFEGEVHETIVRNRLFKRGERVAIAASGGKDSTVLAHVMTLLNERHDYGLDLFLLSVDEGITGYRDDSLETVKRNKVQYKVPLEIVSYAELYGWTMDAIVKEIGLRNNCTFCGVFRRQALDRGAWRRRADKMVTGHNADDVAETVLMNILRGDVARLSRCVSITTGSEGKLPRSKPFKYCYEKEIVMYAHFKRLDYFSTECVYSPNAYRGYARTFLKDLEAVRPSAILDILHSAENFTIAEETKMPTLRECERCGYIASNRLCKACVLLEGLNRGQPRIALGGDRRRAGWTENSRPEGRVPELTPIGDGTNGESRGEHGIGDGVTATDSSAAAPQAFADDF